MNTFGERLKELRLEENLTRAQLSIALNVNDSTISRWENGKIIPGIDDLYNIAVFFNVSADYLIGLIN